MATTDEIGEQAMNFMSSTFGLPPEWFNGLPFVFYFLIPILGLIFLWYTFLQKRLGIFRGKDSINFMLAVLISLMSSFVIKMLTPTFTLAIAIGAGVLLWGRFSLKRIIAGLVLAWMFTFFYPYLIDVVMNAIPA